MGKLTDSEEKFLAAKKLRQKRFNSNFLKASVALFLIWGGVIYFVFHVLNARLSNLDFVPIGMFVHLVIIQTFLLILIVVMMRGTLLGEGKLIHIVEKLRGKNRGK